MIIIDGSFGEGGGQILRSSLGLSMYTGQSVTITNIRAGRHKPGLLRQHYTAVKAAAEICNAVVEGHELGSQELVFIPGTVTHGDYHYSIGSAGSATLVLQTILPALFHADDTSTVIIEGGTHNDMSPPFDFVAKTFVPQLRKMGVDIDVELMTYGFYPAGGGKIKVTIKPVKEWRKLSLLERSGEPVLSVIAKSANITRKIGEHEVYAIGESMEIPQGHRKIEEVKSVGPGNVVLCEIDCGTVTEIITGFGTRGKKKEKVTTALIREIKEFINSNVPVGEHLADQLLIPMALAGGGEFKTVKPTDHTLTNIEVIKRFIDVNISCTKDTDTTWIIKVSR